MRFFAVLDKIMEIQCEDCSSFYEVEGMWPPNYEFCAICPDCGATAQWEPGRDETVCVLKTRKKQEWEGSS